MLVSQTSTRRHGIAGVLLSPLRVHIIQELVVEGDLVVGCVRVGDVGCGTAVEHALSNICKHYIVRSIHSGTRPAGRGNVTSHHSKV